jgi:hypothetical protein
MDLARGDQIKNDGKTDDCCNAITDTEGRMEHRRRKKRASGFRELRCFL